MLSPVLIELKADVSCFGKVNVADMSKPVESTFCALQAFRIAYVLTRGYAIKRDFCRNNLQPPAHKYKSPTRVA
jgi:hypothetical protein